MERPMTNLQKYREKRKLSKYRLSELSGVSDTYISWLENGKRDINDMTVKKVKDLAKALGVNYTDLID